MLEHHAVHCRAPMGTTSLQSPPPAPRTPAVVADVLVCEPAGAAAALSVRTGADAGSSKSLCLRDSNAVRRVCGWRELVWREAMALTRMRPRRAATRPTHRARTHAHDRSTLAAFVQVYSGARTVDTHSVFDLDGHVQRLMCVQPPPADVAQLRRRCVAVTRVAMQRFVALNTTLAFDDFKLTYVLSPHHELCVHATALPPQPASCLVEFLPAPPRENATVKSAQWVA